MYHIKKVRKLASLASCLLFISGSAFAADNLIVNGDFETADLSAWPDNSSVSVITDEGNGNHYLTIAQRSKASGSARPKISGVTSDTTYRITAKIKVDDTDATDTEVTFRFTYKDIAGTVINVDETVGSLTDWMDFTHDFYLPANADSTWGVRLQIKTSGDIDETVHLDDVEMYEVVFDSTYSDANTYSNEASNDYWTANNIAGSKLDIMRGSISDSLYGESADLTFAEINDWLIANATEGWRFATLEEFVSINEFFGTDHIAFIDFNGDWPDPTNQIWYFMNRSDYTDGDTGRRFIVRGAIEGGESLGVVDQTTIRANDTNKSKRTALLVRDVVELTITAPNDITLEATAFETPVDLGLPTVVGGVNTQAAIASEEGPFGVAVHDVLWSVSDDETTVTATQTITITDTTKPVLSAVAAISVVGTGDLTPVELPLVTATDIVDGVLNAIVDNAGPYPVGTTTITWTATDTAENSTSQTQDIVVLNPADVVTITFDSALTALTQEATAFETPVALTAPTANDGEITATINNAGPYGVGTHDLTWTATHVDSGQFATLAQTLTITDGTAPSFGEIATVTIEATATNTDVSLATVIAVDLVDGDVEATHNAAASYPLGPHDITWTATDNTENSSTANSIVIIQDTTAPIFPALADIVLNADETGLVDVTIVPLVITDAVNGELTATHDFSEGAYGPGTITFTWTVSDGINDDVTATQNVVVNAYVAPASKVSLPESFTNDGENDFWTANNLNGKKLDVMRGSVSDSLYGESINLTFAEINAWLIANATQGWRFATLEEFVSINEFFETDHNVFINFNGDWPDPDNLTWYFLNRSDYTNADTGRRFTVNGESLGAVDQTTIRANDTDKSRRTALLVRDFVDTDGDGVGDNADAFPNDPSEQVDTDGNGIGNNADTDDDGDGVLDDDDAFPLDSTESVDTDGDGVGDNADAFPNDASKQVNTVSKVSLPESFTNDGENDFWTANNLNGKKLDVMRGSVSDNLYGESVDLTFAEINDWLNANATQGWRFATFEEFVSINEFFETDHNAFINFNGDWPDPNDQIWYFLNRSDYTDGETGRRFIVRGNITDGESLGAVELTTRANDTDKSNRTALLVRDAADPVDTDLDGVLDADDAFPLDATESVDTDGDGVGNNADTDDDGDGVLDADDAFPIDATESVDTDGDGVGDNADAFPNDASKQVNTASKVSLPESFINDGENDFWTANNLNGKKLDVMRGSVSDSLYGESVDLTFAEINDWLNANATQGWRFATFDEFVSINEFFETDHIAFINFNGDWPDPDNLTWYFLNRSDYTDGNTGRRFIVNGESLDAVDQTTIRANDTSKSKRTALLVRDATDTDGDGVLDADDTFPLDATESVDTDGDGMGNNADTDDDGDGVLDADDAFPLDVSEQVDTDGDGVGDNTDAFPNDASEQVDTDNDGYGDNLDPAPNDPADVSAPVISWVDSSAATFVINATGLITEVNGADITSFIAENIMATDQLIPGDGRDENTPVVVALGTDTQLISGAHSIQLSSTDSEGNIGYLEISVHVNPVVQMGVDLVVESETTLTVPVKLLGQTATYPIELSYSVTPSSTGITSEPLILTIAATDANPVISYALSNEQSGETIVVTLMSATNATVINEENYLGESVKPSVTAEVISGNIAPVVTFTVAQAEADEVIDGVITVTESNIKNVSTIAGGAGLVTVTANISDVNMGDEHCITFSSTGGALTEYVDVTDNDEECRQSNTFTFDPNLLASGAYTLVVSVLESNTDVPFTTEALIALPVTADVIEVIADSDSDGIPDAYESAATVNDATVLSIMDEQAPLQVAAGLSLSLGDIAKDNAGTNGFVATVEREQVQNDLHFSAISTITNFNISGLQQLGDSVSVVLPLADGVVIPADAVYRKYTELNGDWFDFVVDDNNQLSSALKDAQGNCPAPNSVSYIKGLTEGNNCIQLTIEDGGLNDGDSMANGTVVDPGVLVTKNDNTPPVIIVLEAHAANSGEQFNLNALVNDAEEDDITYTWIQLDTDPALLAEVVNANAKSGVFIAPGVEGLTELTFSLTLNDGYDDSEPQEFTVKVATVNHKPEYEVDRKAGSFGWIMGLLTLASLVTRRLRKYK